MAPIRFLPLLLCPLMLGGCKTVELVQLMLHERQYHEDRLLEAEILGELAADPQTADADLDVDVYLKQVRITGRAEPLQFRRAAEIAQAVPLVESVTPAAPAPALAGRD